MPTMHDFYLIFGFRDEKERHTEGEKVPKRKRGGRRLGE